MAGDCVGCGKNVHDVQGLLDYYELTRQSR
jgi:hypothetical protein